MAKYSDTIEDMAFYRGTKRPTLILCVQLNPARIELL